MSAAFFWRRAFPTLLLVSIFLVLYEATVSDSRFAARQAELIDGAVRLNPGDRVQFDATAYCKGSTTASGVAVRSGIAAADRNLLPVGSVIQAEFASSDYDGLYTIMDTGPEIQGRELDVYMWSCFEALRFGRQPVNLVVLRLGWNPRDTTPLMDTLFHRRTPAAPSENDPPGDPNGHPTAQSPRGGDPGAGAALGTPPGTPPTRPERPRLIPTADTPQSATPTIVAP